jgi:hypothetical protein
MGETERTLPVQLPGGARPGAESLTADPNFNAGTYGALPEALAGTGLTTRTPPLRGNPGSLVCLEL